MEENQLDKLVDKGLQLAQSVLNTGDTEQAFQIYSKLIGTAPTNPKLIEQVVRWATATKNYPAAKTLLEEKYQQNTQSIHLLRAVCGLSIFMGDMTRAYSYATDMLQKDPSVTSLYTMASVLSKLGRMSESVVFAEQAAKAEPENGKVLAHLGYVYRQLGRTKEAVETTEKAIPKFGYDYQIQLFSNKLFFQSEDFSLSQQEYIDSARQFGDLVKQNVKPFSTWKCDKTVVKRIGFVSGDWRAHPVSKFCLNTFTALKQLGYELVAYYTHDSQDQVTQKFKPVFNEWNNIHGQADADVARKIRDDKINILIDMSGHTAGNRLGVFGYKPAPVQATWLGYFASTGLDSIDYFIRDKYSAPESFSEYYSESIFRIKTTQCYDIPSFKRRYGDYPYHKNGYLTLGCFNSLPKIKDEVLDLWCTVLGKISDSKFYLRSKEFTKKDFVDSWAEKFEQRGIDRSRLIFDVPKEAQAAYFDSMNHVDFCLDTFPFSGATVNAECLLMGLPYISLSGDRVVARMGISMLEATGNSQWVALNEADYVDKAVELAGQITRGEAKPRTTIRDEIYDTPLFNSKMMGEELDSAFKTMWETYLSKTSVKH